MSLIQDVFTYFAKFPLKEGVLKNFNKAESYYGDYPTFKDSITNMVIHFLVPTIKEFVFGVDESVVRKRIGEVSGMYLFVDYGNIQYSQDHLKRNISEFHLAITVAIPIDPENIDYAEQVLVPDYCHAALQEIKNHMQADNTPFVKQLEFPNEMTPFVARELHNSVGWTLIFRKIN